MIVRVYAREAAPVALKPIATIESCPVLTGMTRYVTSRDYTFASEARRVSLFIPAGTEVVRVEGTTSSYAMARPTELPGCRAWDAQYYRYWVPEDIVTEIASTPMP